MRTYRFPAGKQAVDGGRMALSGSDARHIRNVLRLKPGDRIVCFDGAGLEYEARIDEFADEAVVVSILSSNRPRRESPLRIVVAQALLKEKKMDGVVRQLTELGASGWIPFAAARSVPRPDRRKLEARTDRWRRIAVEAAKQCRRLKAPEIEPAADLEGALKMAESFDVKMLLWEEAPGHQRWPKRDEPVESAFLLLGPEGGLTGEEAGRAEASGFVSASLGPRILRAETAAVVACALVQHRWGDLGDLGKAPPNSGRPQP